jgi:hypothetical protein
MRTYSYNLWGKNRSLKAILQEKPIILHRITELDDISLCRVVQRIGMYPLKRPWGLFLTRHNDWTAIDTSLRSSWQIRLVTSDNLIGPWRLIWYFK